MMTRSVAVNSSATKAEAGMARMRRRVSSRSMRDSKRC
ncbi:MAG: hypothetical protein ACI9NC_002729, partial [Verrucomicrobiales bacterium]